ncbi:MAG: ATP12 family protein [Pseudomonadota bacterium]
MTDWKARRFWDKANVEPVVAGFAVRLDGRPVRTPLKTELAVPSHALAEGIAEEWRAQVEIVDPRSMPLTRAANATLDKVMPQRAEVAAGLSDYGGSDLLCYRAEGPDGLIARQVDAWDPLLDWAARRFGVQLVTTSGVMPAQQPRAGLTILQSYVAGLTPWELTALSEFVSLSGSLVLGLAILDGQDADDIWARSRVDETWQAEQWGQDEEEAARVAVKRADFLQACRYLDLLRLG